MDSLEDQERIIVRARVCRIGMCLGQHPYVAPVNFGYERGSLFFHSAREGKKIRILRENPRVCFEMEGDVEVTPAPVSCRWGMRYESVIGYGTATFLEDPQDKARGLGILFRHYARESMVVSNEELATVVVVRVDIESMTGKCSGNVLEGIRTRFR